MSIVLMGIIGVIQFLLLGHYFFRGLKYKKSVQDRKTIGDVLVTLMKEISE